jgi:hypothetical protein
MSDAPIVASFAGLLQAFAPCFTAPSFSSFITLMSGWVLNVGRHTVTQTIQAAGAVNEKHISSFHRFFSQGRWSVDDLGLCLARLILSTLASRGTAHLIVDDTLGRHTGKRIAGASMHRDPLLSTARRPTFHWGHVWVVMSVHVELFGKGWPLPVLARRSRKRCKHEKRAYKKTTEHARDLIELMAEHFPGREFVVIGDAAYTNSSLIKGRPNRVTLIGRGRLDAALFARPPKPRRGQMGRPRLKGERLPSPEKHAQSKKARWQNVEVNVYGKTAIVRVLVTDALWYVAAGGELVRLVLVRGFPNHAHDDVFVCTDPKIGPREIIETYSLRWSLEVTFQGAKGKLGFEEPQNRTERAVEHTAPMALLGYSLVVFWYATIGHDTRAARLPAMPWYDKNGLPTFSDMLATLRRASWGQRLSDPRATTADLRKRFRPLIDFVSTAA